VVINCRQVTPCEWQEWRDLRLRALRDTPEAFSSTLADWQDADELRWRDRLRTVEYNVIVDVDDVPAGMASCAMNERAGELMSFWITPSARGKGVADALLGAIVEWAVSARCDTVTLGVRAANRHAIALYERHGFIDIGPDHNDDPAAPPERRMILRIGDHRFTTTP
jgi:ribosomal protein S18 acetylase RimI-like enzyme